VTATGENALEEAETFFQLLRDQVAQRDVVDQHHQPHRGRGLFERGPHRHVGGDDRHLGLEVDAPFLGQHRDRVARPDKGVGPALVHQRIGIKGRRHRGAARLAHQFHVVDVGRTVGPLEGTRQRRRAFLLDEGVGARRSAVVQRGIDAAQLWRDTLPVVQRRLQGARDVRNRLASDQVAADDDQRTVAAARLEGSEFHAFSFIVAIIAAITTENGAAYKRFLSCCPFVRRPLPFTRSHRHVLDVSVPPARTAGGAALAHICMLPTPPSPPRSKN
jgi:hypothetical protein